ncbi:hypothetical protein CI684_04090 [Shigella sonnei]|nr:hypothetical protein CI685_18240 [Shigella sonnei]OYJ22997.1 hypothetical protein CI684_04090 [Shigella sonnei]
MLTFLFFQKNTHSLKHLFGVIRRQLVTQDVFNAVNELADCFAFNFSQESVGGWGFSNIIFPFAKLLTTKVIKFLLRLLK